MKRVTFTRPPRMVRRARLDNVALVPANLLPFKDLYQQLANDLPEGATLIIVPKPPSKPAQTLSHVAHQITAEGHQVRIVPATQFVRSMYRPCSAKQNWHGELST